MTDEPTEKAPPRKRAPRKTAAAAPAAGEGSGAARGDGTAALLARIAELEAQMQTPNGDPEEVPVQVAWARVMRDVGPLAKLERNNTPGASFMFRGIDATQKATGDPFRAHGVFVLPVAAEMLESERYETKSGAHMHGMVTRHTWLIMGPMGDTMTMQTLGQAADSGDKAASKAASVSFRTALLEGLNIPTGDPDPDATSHERGTASGQQAETPADPRQPLWEQIKARGAELKLAPPEVAADYSERMGHWINSEEATVETLTRYLETMTTPPPTADPVADPVDPTGRHESDEAVAPSADVDPGPMDGADPITTPDAPPARAPRAGEPGGPDKRQKLWDGILERAAKLRWTPEEVRTDFTLWASTAEGVEKPLEIDGPDTDNDVLTRYSARLTKRVQETTK